MRYLIYNAHGPKAGKDDVKDLVADKDQDTVALAIDWTAESDARLDDLLKNLGMTGISSLPCVIYFVPAHDEVDPETGKTITVPDRWMEHRFVEKEKRHWTWANIDNDITEKTRTVD